MSEAWKNEIADRVRALIEEAVPDVREERKWKKPSNPDGVPTFSTESGLICTLETYRDKVKLTFADGASIDDPDGLFNASLEASVRRAIDLREGDTLNQQKFIRLVKRAAKHTAA